MPSNLRGPSPPVRNSCDSSLPDATGLKSLCVLRSRCGDRSPLPNSPLQVRSRRVPTMAKRKITEKKPPAGSKSQPRRKGSGKPKGGPGGDGQKAGWPRLAPEATHEHEKETFPIVAMGVGRRAGGPDRSAREPAHGERCRYRHRAAPRPKHRECHPHAALRQGPQAGRAGHRGDAPRARPHLRHTPGRRDDAGQRPFSPGAPRRERLHRAPDRRLLPLRR